MTDDDVARNARSVAYADAPGREVWHELAKLEAVHASACVRQARQTNRRLLTHLRISRNAATAAERVAAKIDTAWIGGERLAFMHRAWGHRNARNEWLKKAARSESEDTQPKAAPSQADVDALVKAAAELCAAHPLDDAVIDLELALQPFQKG